MRRALALTAAATITVALAACSPVADSETRPASTAAPVEVTAPPVTANPDPIPGVGATITSHEEAVAADTAGLGVYITNDGTQLVIDPKAPTPQVVIDEARASGLGPVAPPDRETMDDQIEVLKSAFERAEAAGKKVVFIFQTGTYGDWDDDDLKATHYGAYLPQELRTGPLGACATPQELRDKLQPRIDAQSDPSIYEFVDLTV
ncbi:hypothetical protein [Actinotalea solisilvae]|uniref:hypothetical protein n=1 Tax=Actinotalea solisilvae TaxID=2072922 RepID=UPI0018F26E6A|nr:hypothetical protein [Actinotalea solisilvae]